MSHCNNTLVESGEAGLEDNRDGKIINLMKIYKWYCTPNDSRESRLHLGATASHPTKDSQR